MSSSMHLEPKRRCSSTSRRESSPSRYANSGAHALGLEKARRTNKAVPAGSKHGILGMQERVGAFGGVLVAEPVPGRGFRVQAHIPLKLRDGP